mmetsp:Transcript_22730/g.49789  ORF Transcript_22730/g.49789 Transcript_22730/m.49789 type:complete len:200 (+) Transcript_22730:1158-1757(+)
MESGPGEARCVPNNPFSITRSNSLSTSSGVGVMAILTFREYRMQSSCSSGRRSARRGFLDAECSSFSNCLSTSAKVGCKCSRLDCCKAPGALASPVPRPRRNSSSSGSRRGSCGLRLLSCKRRSKSASNSVCDFSRVFRGLVVAWQEASPSASGRPIRSGAATSPQSCSCNFTCSCGFLFRSSSSRANSLSSSSEDGIN